MSSPSQGGAEERGYFLHVEVIDGKNISVNKLKGFFDKPDPYIVLKVPKTPNGRKVTNRIDDSTNPVWNEKFKFIIGPSRKYDLEVKLMDYDVIRDDTIDTVLIDISSQPLNKENEVTANFKNGSEVRLKLLIKEDSTPHVNYIPEICPNEKGFVAKRTPRILKAMKKLLGDRAPKNVDEMPVVSFLGSGGGFRALIADTGAVSALTESGIWDCMLYAASLSGSTWFMSWLYSHPEFPEKDVRQLIGEIRENLATCRIEQLRPSAVWNMSEGFAEKIEQGQPVSLTDPFGRTVGDAILRDRIQSRLSEQQRVIKDGAEPLPIYTCVAVKNKISAQELQDWQEFTPYEIGMPRYGMAIPPELYGSKFYAGHIIRQFNESPLHFLLGVWGNAFSIAFSRILGGLNPAQEKKDPIQILREMRKQAKENGEDDEIEKDDLNNSDSENECYDDDDDGSKDYSKKPKWWIQEQKDRINRRKSRVEFFVGFFGNLLKSLTSFSFLGRRMFRAGVIFNPFRGLTPLDELKEDVGRKAVELISKGPGEVVHHSSKIMLVVDAGLAFNLPFPPLLRKERKVDIIISVDASARDSDEAHPFEEILLAEIWAREHKMPFPHVHEQVDRLKEEPVRECYVFEDPSDPNCPIIFHFVPHVGDFKEFKAPGVRRETAEELEFGNFSVFSSFLTYSTFKFQYAEKDFDRLSKLMEYNILKNVDSIKNKMAAVVQNKRKRSKK